MTDKTQIHPTVKVSTIQAIQGLAEGEIRTFSNMVDILLAEAVEAREEAKNKVKNEN